MSDDVVAQLKDLQDGFREHSIEMEVLQHAIDKIVGLQATVERQRLVLSKGHAQTRDEALEEAAHECDEEAKGSGGEVAFRDGCETCAAAIRLLKEKR